jgi:hypothetical protein
MKAFRRRFGVGQMMVGVACAGALLGLGFRCP